MIDIIVFETMVWFFVFVFFFSLLVLTLVYLRFDVVKSIYVYRILCIRGLL